MLEQCVEHPVACMVFGPGPGMKLSENELETCFGSLIPLSPRAIFPRLGLTPASDADGTALTPALLSLETEITSDTQPDVFAPAVL